MGAVAADPRTTRDRRLLQLARGAAALGAIGAATSPPLANTAVGILLLAVLLAPSGPARLWSAIRQPLGSAAMLFAALLAISMMWTEAPAAQAWRELASWRVLLLVLLGIAIFDEVSVRERFAVWLVWYGALALGLALVMLGLGRSIDGVQSPGIVLRNEATQAIYFAVTAALAAWLARARSGSVRLAYAGLAFALAANVAFLGASRSGYVVLAILALGFALSATSTKARVLAAFACVAGSVVVAATSPVAQQRVKEGWQQVLDVESTREASSMGVRLVFWRTSLGLIAERPALGYGVGGFRTAYARAVADREGWRAIQTSDPHNQYLLIAVAAGLCGLAAFGWLLVSVVRQRTTGWTRAAGLSITAAWCATSLFNSHFSAFNEGHLIALLWGALLAEDAARPLHGRHARDPSP